MKAIVYGRYGSPDVLQLTEIDQPVVSHDQVLVRVRAASLNPADWHFMRGLSYLVRLINGLRKPRKATVLASDLAGQVEAVGKTVTRLRQEDFTRSGRRYDLILDAGDRSLSDLRRALTPKGTLVVIGRSAGRWIDGLGRAYKARVVSPLVRQRLRLLLTKWSKQDLQVVKDLIDAGKVTLVID